MDMSRLLACLAGCAMLHCGSGSGGREADPAADIPLDAADPGMAETTEGIPCDDGDPCTHGDTVKAGVCAGTPYDCKSGTPFCATRECDGKGGCEVSEVKAGYCFVDGACFSDGTKDPKDACRLCDAKAGPTAWGLVQSGTPCNDGNPCTKDDKCGQTACGGDPVDCDDGNGCTKDACDEKLGCTHEPIDGTCDDGDPCTVGDACGGGTCKPGGGALECDDKDPCTVDSCEANKGCVHLDDPAKACDDGNDCTKDTCAPATGCAHEKLDGVACEDGDLCNAGDTCVKGVCQKGTGKADCDDKSTCTEDSCVPAKGCIHANLKGSCNDGNSCTIDDECVGGKCIGQKTSSCGKCAYPANTEANKLTVIQLGSSGHPGQGMDLDGDKATCAPATDCSGGIDNELGLLAAFVNGGLKAAVENETLVYLVEFLGFAQDGSKFTVNFLAGKLAEAAVGCNTMTEQCDYVPFWEALDPSCKPIMAFDNAKVEGGKIVAGGPGYTFAFKATLVGGGIMAIAMSQARIEATYKLAQGGESVYSLDGFIGGAVDKQELLDTVQKLPEETFPISKEEALKLLDTLIVNDLDTDGDGKGDAASVNLRISSIPANIVVE